MDDRSNGSGIIPGQEKNPDPAGYNLKKRQGQGIISGQEKNPDLAGYELEKRRIRGAIPGQEGMAPRIRVFDLHCDTLDRLALDDDALYPAFAEQNKRMGIAPNRLATLKDNDAHLSLDRMSGFAWCQCFAIFLPDGLGAEKSWILYQHVKSFFEGQLRRFSDHIEQVPEGGAVEGILARGKCAALLTVEGGPFLEGSLSRIDEIAEAGVKMLTLTWNGPNAIASGNETDQGLSLFGKDVIRMLEEKRIVVDVSHLNDRSFSGLAATAQRPFAASHSNSRAVCAHPRNLTDYQFTTIAERGGIVGLNFCNRFLSETHADPTPDDVLRHIDHWLELGGRRTIALGTDYDGADVPSWLSAGEKLGALHELVQREFGADIAELMFFENASSFFVRNETV